MPLPVVAALPVGLVLPVVITLASRHARARLAKPRQASSWSLPNSPPDRRSFAAVAVSAGGCEEVLARGLLLRDLTALLPGLGGTGAVLAAALVFAPAHTYQGASGVVAAVLTGLGLTALFVASHSFTGCRSWYTR